MYLLYTDPTQTSVQYSRSTPPFLYTYNNTYKPSSSFFFLSFPQSSPLRYLSRVPLHTFCNYTKPTLVLFFCDLPLLIHIVIHLSCYIVLLMTTNISLYTYLTIRIDPYYHPCTFAFHPNSHYLTRTNFPFHL